MHKMHDLHPLTPVQSVGGTEHLRPDLHGRGGSFVSKLSDEQSSSADDEFDDAREESGEGPR